MTEILHPLRLPLEGTRLIEASAGTGKTWTIASLYVRLVIESRSGVDGANGTTAKPLTPPEILVMTFTKAATRELTDRIRKRLVEAAKAFTDPHTTGLDPLLAELREQFAIGPARELAAYRLKMAAEAMDEAAIHTIDSWCQRMLREHDVGLAGWDESLVPDEGALLTEAVHDYWRQQVYPLSREALADVQALWPKVDTLLAQARAWRENDEGQDLGSETLADVVAVQRQRFEEQVLPLGQAWVQKATQMREWLDDQTTTHKKRWNLRKLQSRFYTVWLDKLEAWAQDPAHLTLDLPAPARHRLSPSGMHEALAEPSMPFSLPDFFAAFEQLIATLDALNHWQRAFAVHASAHIQHRVATLKKQARLFGFKDLLVRLHQALTGPGAEALAERLRQQFPVAMVDEFQDTSPLQLSLLESIYSLGAQGPCALLLIGDPKQSIYGFRGADIDSYLRARRATVGRHYVLGTNYRSSHALVQVVNRLFEGAEHTLPQGAFMLGEPGVLPYFAVQAKGQDRALKVADQWAAPLEVCYEATAQSKTHMQAQFAQLCAQKIVSWLADPSAQWQGTGDAEQPAPAPLRPADIAVLVRTRTEANAVRQALRERGVASVYLSDHDSVFDTTEARDILSWLMAVAAPRDAQRVRTGFATEWMGWTTEESRRLVTDDDALDQRCEQLAALRAVWNSQGVLAMLRQTLHQLGLPAQWLLQADGERRLTNTLHLAELLQTASKAHPGEAALIRYLASEIQSPSLAGDEPVLRLESEADLVQVITIHKSKGLEFAVVCLPFACGYRAADKQPNFVVQRDAKGHASLSFFPTQADADREQSRRLQEDIRLLYVALTRAKYAVWMGFSALTEGNSKDDATPNSGLGYLLQGHAPAEVTVEVEVEAGQVGWTQALQAWAASSPGMVLTPAPEQPTLTVYERIAPTTALAPAPRYQAQFERDWGISSYSALVRTPTAAKARPIAETPPLSVGARALPKGLEELTVLDTADESQEVFANANESMALQITSTEALPDARPNAPWKRVSKGPLTGNFLHEQLEWLAQEKFAIQPARLLARCERAGQQAQAQDLCDWLDAIVNTPLPPLGLPLVQLNATSAELEFWMPLAALPVAEVDALCQSIVLPGVARPALPERQLNGLMMGFADLVFEHQGRFWVLDYKSNDLGDHDQAYQSIGLAQAVLAHRYDVQAMIYQLALHRLLGQRLGQRYQPSVHLGGVLFYFLRGLAAPTRGVLHLPVDLMALAAFDALLAGQEGAP